MMKKENLIKLLETLEIEEIKTLEIEYYIEKNYGVYDNREPITLKINKENK